MKSNNLKIQSDFFESGYEDLSSYCTWLMRKNNVVIHLIENYVGKQMKSDPELLEIRNIILDVSGDIARLPYRLMNVSDEQHEEL